MEGVGRRGAPVHRGKWFHLWPSCFAIQLGVQMGPQHMHTALRFVDNGGWQAALLSCGPQLPRMRPGTGFSPLLQLCRSSPAPAPRLQGGTSGGRRTACGGGSGRCGRWRRARTRAARRPYRALSTTHANLMRSMGARRCRTSPRNEVNPGAGIGVCSRRVRAATAGRRERSDGGGFSLGD